MDPLIAAIMALLCAGSGTVIIASIFSWLEDFIYFEDE